MNETDDDLREILLAIDESDDICATSWEAYFIESAVYKWQGAWTLRQKRAVIQIIEKYQDRL